MGLDNWTTYNLTIYSLQFDNSFNAMRRFLLCTLCLFGVLCVSTYAQDTENYGAVWTEVGATKVLPYNLSLEGGVGFRTLDWFHDANRFDASIGLGYKLGKYLKFGLSYTFIERRYLEKTEYKYAGDYDFSSYQGAVYVAPDGLSYDYEGYNIDGAHWAQRHRVSFDITADKRFWKTLRISLRERYQFTHQSSRAVNRTKLREPSFDGNVVSYAEEEQTVKEKEAWNRHLLRSRLKFAIDKKGWNWEPFVSAELHNDLGNSWHLDKIRCAAGTEYAISKQHKVSAAYVFTHENDDDGNENIHAISVGYKFKF